MPRGRPFGARGNQLYRKMPTMTQAEVEKLKAAGEVVIEHSDSTVTLDGGWRFKIVKSATVKSQARTHG